MDILTATLEIVRASQNKRLTASTGQEYGIRINNYGSYLEDFVAAAFANALQVDDIEKRNELRRKAFCYEGSLNFSPDLMLHDGGPAIEVKKHETDAGGLRLNSSPPRQTLRKADKRIAPGARAVEGWTERKLIYVVGTIPKGSHVVKSIQLVYGDCFAANHAYYDKAEEKIGNLLDESEVENLTSYEGNELGRMNAVDPLRASYLRVRGIWEMKNPLRIFKEEGVSDYTNGKGFKGFTLLALMKRSEFEAVSKATNAISELKKIEGFVVKDVEITDPDNISKKINAVLIKYQKGD